MPIAQKFDNKVHSVRELVPHLFGTRVVVLEDEAMRGPNRGQGAAGRSFEGDIVGLDHGLDGHNYMHGAEGQWLCGPRAPWAVLCAQ